MENVRRKAHQYLDKQRKVSRWHKVVTVLAGIVVFCTTYALILPALTMTTPLICGYETEHTHDESCYTVETVTVRRELTCETEETEGHAHDESCYTEMTTYACGQVETEPHTHSDECKGLVRGELNCDKEFDTVEIPAEAETVETTEPETVESETTETETIENTEATESAEVVENTEIAAAAEIVIVDTVTENVPHEHTDACYSWVEALVCGTEETEGHIHTEDCGAETRDVLTCETEATEGHAHSDECYEIPENEGETVEIRTLTCETPEHTHHDNCYLDLDLDEGFKLICGFDTEHAHSEDCYFEDGELKCTITEHEHDVECLDMSMVQLLDATDDGSETETQTLISWGEVKPSVSNEEQDGLRTWMVAGSEYRYLQIPVSVNVSGSKSVEITLPLRLNGGRDGYAPRCNYEGVATGSGWTKEVTGTSLILKMDGSEEATHKSLDIYYTVDCWNMISGAEIALPYTIKVGDEQKDSELKGKIVTDHSLEQGEYFYSWGDSAYSYSGFGGTDKASAYVQQWNSVYETLFGLKKSDFNNSYIYDVVPFLVVPEGQQPYDISGTLTLDQGGKVLGGIYMMDSRSGETYKSLNVTESGAFTLSNDELNVVSGNLVDTVDNKCYTLYFLVRYLKTDLTVTKVLYETQEYVQMNATLTLTHTGVDSNRPETRSMVTCLYDGPRELDMRIYWASYVSNAESNRAGLSSLEKGYTTAVSLSADFFCLNEARTDRSDSDTYTLEAIIDLAYLNSSKTQLTEGDYRISAFQISLIDAMGSWSQNSHGVPNVGWTQDKFGAAPAWAANEKIYIYGSTSLSGDDWQTVGTVNVADVWALNTDRGFLYNSENKIAQDNIVRLKVVYNSHLTTALRVGYTMEMKPQLLNKVAGLSSLESLDLIGWFNYTAKKNGAADLADMRFQRYPVSDGGGWDTATAGTIELARQYDHNMAGITGFNAATGVWDVGYSLRNFARISLGRSNDVAGMIVTQALYDNKNDLVGDPLSIDPNLKDSYSKQKNVTNVSEIVFSVSGVVTNGAGKLTDLQERVNKAAAEENSPYRSLKMRYYVLLPEGMELNRNPDNGEVDEEGNPKYHFWTWGTDRYLSANSAFYNTNSPKAVQAGQTDVPMTSGTVDTWKEISGNGNLTEMYWVAGGSVTENKSQSNGRLVVFERELGNWCDYDRFNMWGSTETYFWGRGLSFSVIPTGGTGALAEGDYTTHIWCQYLDANGNPISLADFLTIEDENKEANRLGNALGSNMDAGSLLYIPVDFHNYSGNGDSTAKITLESKDKDEQGTPIVRTGEEYRYDLTYRVDTNTGKDVVLWCNVEMPDADGKNPKWDGTILGVDLSKVPESERANVKVFVRTEWFDINAYTDSLNGNTANSGWLDNENYGWKLVDLNEFKDWDSVKSVAFYFEGITYTAGTDHNGVTVSINMKAPEEDEVEKGPEEIRYTANTSMVFSDGHGTGEAAAAQSCTAANIRIVNLVVNFPAIYELPSTGGAGTIHWYAMGILLLAMAAVLMYNNNKKQRGDAVC